MIDTEHARTSVSRRALLGGGLKLAGAAALAGTAGGLLDSIGLGAPAAGAAPLAKVPFQLGWVTNTEFAGTYLAQEDGYFAKGGIAVDLLPGGTVAVEPVVASGKALVGDTNADTVSAAVEAGAPLRIIGAKYQKNPFCIISSAKAPIKTPQGLIGKTIGVNAYNLTAWDVFLSLNGIKGSEVTAVNEGYTAGPSALADGQVDAWMGFITNEPGVLTLAGFPNYSYLMADFGYHIYADVYIATVDAIKNSKKELVAFMQGELQGWTLDVEKPAVGTALTTKLYQKAQGFSPKQQALENKAQAALIVTPYTTKHGLFTMNPVDIAKNLAVLKFASGHGTTKYYTGKDLFDTSILEAL
jgi:ABC-type nitrate/sulfonate/bicarbonate transport system substrate-binding protein